MSTRAPFIAALLVAGAYAVPASAEMREVGHDELRQMVASGTALGLGEALALVNGRIAGNLVDVRAFEDDTLYYRVVVKRPDGQLVAAIVDARAGRMVSGRSSAAQEIMAAAKAKPAQSGGAGKGKSSGGSGNRGGNGNGNSGGNGGGNGGGNSGGNGGGNSGNNGKN